MNELINVSKVNELANKELRKNVNAIVKELGKVNKSAWTIAHHYKNIVTGEQYKDDFSSFSDFANFVGVNRATLILYSKVAKLSDLITKYAHEETPVSEVANLENDVTMSKMIELLPLFKGIDELDNELHIGIFYGTINEMGGYEVFKSMTNREVRDWVKFFLAEETKEETEEEREEETEEVREEETEEETEETINEKVIIKDYELRSDNVEDFMKTIYNLIKNGHEVLHFTIFEK